MRSWKRDFINKSRATLSEATTLRGWGEVGWVAQQKPNRWVLRTKKLFAWLNYGLGDSITFSDVISYFLCNPIGPDFGESTCNRTLVARDPRLGVTGWSLRGSLRRALRGYTLVICGFWLAGGKVRRRWICISCLQTATSPFARAIDCCSHAHAKSLHALWPIRAPTLPPAPIRTRPVVTPNRQKANSRTFRRVTLKHARLTQHHVKGCIFCNTRLRPHYLSLAIVPFSLLGLTTNTLLASTSFFRKIFCNVKRCP